jgi:transcriptional regulator with XRE-family HTH domain
MFCGIPVSVVASATGIAQSRVAAIEKGRREPDSVEQRLLEKFLRDNLERVFDLFGVPDWISGSQNIRVQAQESAEASPFERRRRLRS